MEKIDYLKQLKHLYNPSAKKVEIVDVPEMNFLMIDGEGNPNTSQAFKDAVEALFSLSYTLKFMIKKGEMALQGKDDQINQPWAEQHPMEALKELKRRGYGLTVNRK